MVATLVSVITILIVVIWNGIQYRQVKRQMEIQNEHMRLNILSEYTQRWSEVFWRLPVDIYEDSYSVDDLEPKERDEVLKTLRMLFDISSEWFYLYQIEYVDKETWRQFDGAVTAMSKTPAFRTAWSMFSKDPTLSKGFRKYIDSKMRD